MQCALKFSDVLFALSQMDPPIGEALGQVNIFVRSLGQADLWSDVPPVGEALHQVDSFVRSLSQADLWSDVPPPPISEASGQGDLWLDELPDRDILWSSVIIPQIR